MYATLGQIIKTVSKFRSNNYESQTFFDKKKKKKGKTFI